MRMSCQLLSAFFGLILILCLSSSPLPAEGENHQDSNENLSLEIVESSQFGTKRLDFQIAGGHGFLLMPTAPSRDGSKPWVWYSPTFIGLHPSDGSKDPKQDSQGKLVDTERTSNAWFIKQLLKEGFYVGGMGVGESYGSPTGVKQFTEYYDYVVKTFDLSPKVTLYAQSRGGLQNFNWAVEHPDSVLCMTGCQVVLDMRLYPGLEKACSAYGMSVDELESKLSEFNPIDRSYTPLAKAGIPILHVIGDNDNLVPVEQTMEFIRKYRADGGRMELIVNPGIGHGNHVALMAEPRIVDFILKNTFSDNK